MTPEWLESVYSDGSRYFVSSPQPELGQTVTVRLRLYEDAPVRHVFLRTVPNGTQLLLEMRRYRVEHGLAWYSAELRITEPRMQYQFYLACDDAIYYYNQKEVSTCLPDQSCDFVLLADYRQPSWVKSSVFYHIFPERFCNGDPSNDVADGEYTLDGYPAIRMKDWNARPLTYQQGHCLDFFGGDLDGVRRKIPYLKELGVTALYLNPIFTAPSVHKYDCIDYFHVDPHFGGDEALERLSKALHENGMRLILDISINHTGSAHSWFNRDGLFFDKSTGAFHNPQSEERGYYFFDGRGGYMGWLGHDSLPTLNYTSRKLRDIIYAGDSAVLRKWLREPYCIDGWRFDVADVFARNNELQLSHQLWPEIRRAIREENPDAYILAEDWDDCAPYLQGQEWDSPMNYFGFARVFRQLLGQPDLFLMRSEVLRAVPCRLTVEDVKKRITSWLSRLPFVFWQNQFNLIDSHDVPRLHNDPGVHPEEYRGAVIMLFTVIGAPSVYYGDEAGIDGGTETNEDCRYPMPWGTGFEASPVFHLYQTLARLKTANPAFTEGGMKFLYARDGVLSIARFTDGEAFAAVMSVRGDDAVVRLPLGAVGAAAPDGGTDLLGSPIRWRAEDVSHIALSVPAHRAYLFRCRMK